MNTRNLLVSVLTLVCLLFSSCTPATTPSSPTKVVLPTATIIPTVPISTPALPTEAAIILPSGTVLAGKEVVTIKVGSFPQQAAVGEGAVWVPDSGSGTVSRIDPQTNEVVATIPIGNADLNNGRLIPSRVTTGDGYVWVATNDDDSVVQIDPKTNQIVATISLGMTPFALAVKNGTLWVTSRENNSVLLVDVNTQQVVETIPDVKDPTAIAVTEDAIWVVNHRDDAVTRIDPLTNQVVTLISLGTTGVLDPVCRSCVNGIALGAGSVWVSSIVGGVVRIDPQTNQVIAKIPGRGDTFGIASNDEGVWFANWKDLMIFRIDPQTNQVVGAIPVSARVAFLAIDEDVLWVTTDYSDRQAYNKVIRFDIQP